MSFIDWSDPEAMLSLLVEYIEDERSEAHDRERRRFLSSLVDELSELEERFAALPSAERVQLLRSIFATVDEEFRSDPVVEHLEACANELERIGS